MSIQTIMIAGLKKIETDLGSQTFTWEDESFVCSPSTSKAVFNATPGSVSSTKLLIINVRRELFSSGVFPQQNDVISFDDSEWRIMEIDKEPFQVFLRLNCVETDRGAHA